MAKLSEKTTAEEASKEFAGEIKGKTILITGVTPNSLGAEAAYAISFSSPKLLILAGRTLSKLQETEKRIKAASPDVATRLLILDLADQKQIRVAAKEVLGYEESIDRLINNAGIMAAPYSTTADGLEAQFGTNHIGHFLFTNLILSKVLAAGKGARIVNISSAGHRLSAVKFDDVGFSGGKTYDKWKAYGQAKSANILFSVALAERLKDKGVLAYSVHPGSIHTTNLFNYMSDDDFKAMGWMDEKGNKIDNAMFNWRSVEEGSSTHITAAFDTSIADKSGSYLEDNQVNTANLAPHASDQSAANRLWILSEKLVGQKFSV